MSRRFGRNQKRRMREKVAELEATLAKAERRVRDVQKAEDAIRRTLGDRTSALEAEMVHGGNYGYQLSVPAWRRIRWELESSSLDVRVRALILEEVEADVDDDLGRRDAIHLRVRHPGGGISYYVSRRAIQEHPSNVVAEVSRICAEKLVRFLREEGKLCERSVTAG